MKKYLKEIRLIWQRICHKTNNEELKQVNSSLLVNENTIGVITNETKSPKNLSENECKIEENAKIQTKTTEVNCEHRFEFIRQQTYIKTPTNTTLGVSIRGKSHIESNSDCQDFHVFQKLSEGWSLMIVSDGAGSAKYAGRGSKANCIISAKLLSEMISCNQWIKNEHFPSELEWFIEFRSICEKMRLIYQNKIEEMADGTLITDFNATLLVCVITPFGLLSGHIGDGRMGYLTAEGEWKSMMTPHKGEEGNQTLFPQNCWNKPHVPALKISGVNVPETRVVNEPTQAIVLISDGCERSCWECSIYDSTLGKYVDVNKPYPKFMNPLIDSIIKEEESNMLKLFIDIIDKGTKICETERDDKTMLIYISNINHELSYI